MAELLIVVAIIAVLVAVAIPVFNNQLEKSRESVDISTIRNYYAKAALIMMDSNYQDGYSVDVDNIRYDVSISDDETSIFVYSAENPRNTTPDIPLTTLKQKEAGWLLDSDATTIAGITLANAIPDTSFEELLDGGVTYIMFTFENGQLSRITVST